MDLPGSIIGDYYILILGSGGNLVCFNLLSLMTTGVLGKLYIFIMVLTTDLSLDFDFYLSLGNLGTLGKPS